MANGEAEQDLKQQLMETHVIVAQAEDDAQRELWIDAFLNPVIKQIPLSERATLAGELRGVALYGTREIYRFDGLADRLEQATGES